MDVEEGGRIGEERRGEEKREFLYICISDFWDGDRATIRMAWE